MLHSPPKYLFSFTRILPVNSNGRIERVMYVQLSPYGLLLLTQPLHSSEQHIRANLEFSSNFDQNVEPFQNSSEQMSIY